MKKALSLVSSAALAVAMTFSAAAAPQTARKLTAANAAGSELTRTVSMKPNAATSRIHPLKVRTAANAATPSLKKAMKAAHLVQKTSAAKAPAAEAASLPDLRGSVVFQSNWTQENQPTGLYKINADGTTTMQIEEVDASGGAFLHDGIYTATEYMEFWGMLFITATAYDLESGESVAVYGGSTPDHICVGGETVDPTDGTIYAITYNADGDGLQLSKMSYPEDIEATAIAPLDGNWNSIVCDASGQLYGISYEGVMEGENFVATSSALNKIDKNTGEVTLIGETGHAPQYLSSATIDTKTGRMFWTVNPPDETGYLCEVNLATGAATKIVDFALDDEIMGLCVVAPAAEEGAPAAVTDLAADFPEGALSGNVSFKLPTTLFDGSAAIGTLSYKVLANGQQVADGTGAAGADVTAPVTVEEAGEYTIVVTASNAVGDGPKAKLTLFIGKGTPKSPEAALVYEGGKMKLSWPAVTESADGGFIDPAAVTYSVTRIINNESSSALTVASGLTATSFEEEVAMPAEITTYHYLVVAESAGVESAPAKSNSVTLGSVVPPYVNHFDSSDALSGYTIIDGNKDGKVWAYYQGASGADGNPGAARMTYNSDLAMDDWMITPPLKLEGGKAYKVSFQARANSDAYPERVEAKWGNAATAAAMTGVIVAPTDLGKNWVELGAYIMPEADGIYYVGIHGISDKDTYYLYVDDLTVSAPSATTVPGLATDLAVANDPAGTGKATITFKAPAKTMGGETLAAITKIELSRDGNVIKTFDAPAPGAELRHEDTAETGTHTYSVQAFNADGAGEVASVTAFVGIDKPGAPENVQIVETANLGEVTISWDAVTVDQNGNAINSALVTYLVAEPTTTGWASIVDEPISNTTYTFQAVPAGEQDFAQYAIFAVTDGGTGTGAPTDMIPVGTPYEGMEESFPDGTLSYVLGLDSSNGGSWSLFGDDSGIPSQDGDNGFIGMEASYLEQGADLFTGKISLAGAVNPGISFYTYNLVGESGGKDENTIELFVREIGAAEYTALGTPIVIGDLATEAGWVSVNKSLAAYAGKTIQLMFRATCHGFAYTLIDNIKIGDMLENDLHARAISAPAKVKAGADYEAAVTVNNNGTKDATAFTIKLFADGEQVASKTVDALTAGTATTETFTLNMHALAEEPVVLHAEVEFAADEKQDNNKTAEVTVTPQISKLPAVTDLKGEADENGKAHLTWSEPDLNAAPAETGVVDFEDAESFAHEYEGWTFIDADGKPVGGFQNTDIPGIDPGNTLTSFFVFDRAAETWKHESFAAHSGTKYLASLFNYNPSNGLVDDWAISPMLDGSAQTITFYAKSYDSQYSESFDFLYSTTGTETSDFILVGSKKNISTTWTEYSFEVPAGALYFAVRNHDTDAFMLMLDDFTFAPAGASAELSIAGYDVYRDGVKITTEPTGETEFTDTDATDGDHTYVVVAVYDKGISKGSNAVTVSTTGIADITVDSADAEYFNMQGIRVTNPEAGQLYIRRQGGRAAKVMVK